VALGTENLGTKCLQIFNFSDGLWWSFSWPLTVLTTVSSIKIMTQRPAGLDSTWMSPATKLMVKICGGGRPSTAPARMQLPADLAAHEISHAGKDCNVFQWTEDLEAEHEAQVEAVSKSLTEADKKRLARIDSISKACKKSASKEKKDVYRELLSEITAKPSLLSSKSTIVVNTLSPTATQLSAYNKTQSNKHQNRKLDNLPKMYDPEMRKKILAVKSPSERATLINKTNPSLSLLNSRSRNGGGDNNNVKKMPGVGGDKSTSAVNRESSVTSSRSKSYTTPVLSSSSSSNTSVSISIDNIKGQHLPESGVMMHQKSNNASHSTREGHQQQQQAAAPSLSLSLKTLVSPMPTHAQFVISELKQAAVKAAEEYEDMPRVPLSNDQVRCRLARDARLLKDAYEDAQEKLSVPSPLKHSNKV
jgi:hypothetical protein